MTGPEPSSHPNLDPGQLRAAATQTDVAVSYYMPEYDDLPVIYTNLLSITQDGGTVHLSFGLALPPIISSPDQVQAYVNGRVVPARPVARLAVSQQIFLQFATAILQQAQQMQADGLAAQEDLIGRWLNQQEQANQQGDSQ